MQKKAITSETNAMTRWTNGQMAIIDSYKFAGRLEHDCVSASPIHTTPVGVHILIGGGAA